MSDPKKFFGTNMTVKEFIEKGRAAGQDALGVANDPEWPAGGNPQAGVPSRSYTREVAMHYANISKRLKFANELAVDPTRHTPENIEQLISDLSDPNNDVVISAIDAIGHVGLKARSAWKILVSLLQDQTKPSYLRDMVPNVLGELGVTDPLVFEALKVASTDDDNHVMAKMAGEALIKLKALMTSANI